MSPPIAQRAVSRMLQSTVEHPHPQLHELQLVLKAGLPHYRKFFIMRIENALTAQKAFGSGLPAAEREQAARAIAGIVLDALTAEKRR